MDETDSKTGRTAPHARGHRTEWPRMNCGIGIGCYVLAAFFPVFEFTVCTLAPCSGLVRITRIYVGLD